MAYEDYTTFADGDRVALERVSYGVKTNNTVFNNLYHFLVTISAGKITSLSEYTDTFHVKHMLHHDQYQRDSNF